MISQEQLNSVVANALDMWKAFLANGFFLPKINR